MPCPITITKFVGTISLGLLTGLSYSLSTTTLPTLLLLPTASSASKTLGALVTRARSQVFTLTTVSTLSLLLAYVVSPRRSKHPYLLWTSLVTVMGGPGIEWWGNGSKGVREMVGSFRLRRKTGKIEGKSKTREEEEDDGVVVVNGESVERDMERERRIQGMRAVVVGLGFAMGVVGIWGDGA